MPKSGPTTAGLVRSIVGQKVREQSNLRVWNMQCITIQKSIGESLRAALVAGIIGGSGLAAVAPVVALAATAPAAQDSFSTAPNSSSTAVAVQYAALVDIPAPALSPGLPPPELSSMSDRRIIAGLLLVLLAGASAVTATMWRELGRRARAS
jgi:hypothetical protein